jgi:hypothetical protein
VRDLASPNRPHLRGFERHDCRCPAIQRGEFHFVRLAIVVDVNYRPNVAGLKPVGRDRCRQYYSFMFFNHT